MPQRIRNRLEAFKTPTHACPVCGKPYRYVKTRNWGEPVRIEVKRGKKVTLQQLPGFITRSYDCEGNCKQTIDLVTGAVMVGG